jgi:hypothetical protein
MAKRGDDWFPLSQAVVAYDHALLVEQLLQRDGDSVTAALRPSSAEEGGRRAEGQADRW